VVAVQAHRGSGWVVLVADVDDEVAVAFISGVVVLKEQRRNY
jgi:hypothetical protein